jgi:hypothetical protein
MSAVLFDSRCEKDVIVCQGARGQAEKGTCRKVDSPCKEVDVGDPDIVGSDV